MDTRFEALITGKLLDETRAFSLYPPREMIRVDFRRLDGGEVAGRTTKVLVATLHRPTPLSDIALQASDEAGISGCR